MPINEAMPVQTVAEAAKKEPHEQPDAERPASQQSQGPEAEILKPEANAGQANGLQESSSITRAASNDTIMEEEAPSKPQSAEIVLASHGKRAGDLGNGIVEELPKSGTVTSASVEQVEDINH